MPAEVSGQYTRCAKTAVELGQEIDILWKSTEIYVTSNALSLKPYERIWSSRCLFPAGGGLLGPTDAATFYKRVCLSTI